MKRGAPSRLLLDTHTWYWYVSGSADLPRSLREVLDESLGSCWLSPISLWELGILAGKGRLRLFPSCREWIQDALAAFPVQEALPNFEVALRVQDLDLPHPDPGDRFLAATAIVYELTLVTVDRRLVEAPWLPTLTG